MKNYTTPFERFSDKATYALGTPWTFTLAMGFVIGWLSRAYFIGLDDDWMDILTIVTSLITFMMVFIIQSNQNKSSLAVNLKLNEILLSISKTDKRLLDIEKLPQKTLREIDDNYNEDMAESTEQTKHVDEAIKKTLPKSNL